MAVLLAFICLILSSASVQALEFSVQHRDGVSFIFAQGEIERDDDRSLLRVVSGGLHPQTVIMLNSPGGSLAASVRLGRAIRDLGFETFVGGAGVCASACFFSFIGGVRRLMDPDGAIGVHQFVTDSATDGHAATADSQSFSAQLLTHVIEMGVDPAALAKAMETPPTHIYYFDWWELKRLRIVNPDCPFPDEMRPDLKDPLNLYPECAYP